MYQDYNFLVLGFHGTDKSIVDNVLLGKETLSQSENTYDWLGHGIYFWENSPERALEYAKEKKTRDARRTDLADYQKIKNPAVIGAVINLGHCFDLMTSKSLEMLKKTHGVYVKKQLSEGGKIPTNRSLKNDGEKLLRELDCAVINFTHTILQKKDLKPFDSVRGVFFEGDDLYPGAGFKEKNHIQLCIRNTSCIKGFFLPKNI